MLRPRPGQFPDPGDDFPLPRFSIEIESPRAGAVFEGPKNGVVVSVTGRTEIEPRVTIQGVGVRLGDSGSFERATPAGPNGSWSRWRFSGIAQPGELNITASMSVRFPPAGTATAQDTRTVSVLIDTGLPVCPISWQPSALAPVFYGMRDYDVPNGAPGPCRVFFPSIDGAVSSAPILEGCGRYPLILFAHGHCEEVEHYKKWDHLPSQLARSGYVVVVPELPMSIHPSNEDHPALPRMADTVSWMREGWEHRDVLLPEPATGVAGHSYGALVGARFAAEHGVSAYASIAGVWENWPTPPWPIEVLDIPMFFCWGTDDLFTPIGDLLWNSLSLPRHRAIFEGARHWDYLRSGSTLCENGRGPCTLTGALAADLVAMFFATNLPPENWPNLGTQIPVTLMPPPLALSHEQEFFAGGHLLGFPLLEYREGCQVSLTWDTPTGSGTTTRP